MKKLSFKTITTLWIILLIAVICGLSITVLMIMSQRTADDKNKQAIISAVESNMDEMEYSNGIFEVENDFVFYSGGIYCDLFTEKGEYIMGETPEALIHSPKFEDKGVIETEIDGEKYYVYSMLLDFTKYEYEIDVLSGQIISYEVDVTPSVKLSATPYSETNFQDGISTIQAIEIALSHAGVSKNDTEIIGVELTNYHNRNAFKIDFTSSNSSYDKVYIRGICPINETSQAFDAVAKNALYLFPAFIIIAAIGAYIITRKTISPVEKITESAQAISSGNDLSKRLDTGNAPYEIHKLGETFNDMFARLQSSFENEKRFTSDASHELRTPLAVIKAECEYALSENADENDRIEALESINEQNEKMTGLVSSLLAVTRAEQGTTRFKLEKGNISDLISDICENFKTTKNIELNYQIDNDILIDMNSTLITQLIENLLSNADKYGKKNGVIDVKLYEKNDNVILSVKDNGLGICEEDLPKIWNRFYRADSSRSETEGFGLGLSLVKKIAEIHSAECSAKSETNEFTEISIIFKKI